MRALLFALTVAVPALAQVDPLDHIVGVAWNARTFAIEASDGAWAILDYNVDITNTNSLARAPNGVLWAHEQGGGLLAIDPVTGVATRGAATPDLVSVRGMAFASDGQLWAIEASGGAAPDLYTVDIATGAATYQTHIITSLTGLTFAPDGRLLGTHLGLGVVEIDITTGFVDDLWPNDNFSDDPLQTLTFGPDGTLYVANRTLWRVDPSDGTLTAISPLDSLPDIRGMEWVPEPATALLLLSVLLAATRRRAPVPT